METAQGRHACCHVLGTVTACNGEVLRVVVVTRDHHVEGLGHMETALVRHVSCHQLGCGTEMLRC